MFRHAGGERSALARQATQPLISPEPAKEQKRARELLKRKKQAADRTVVLCAAGVALVTGALGAVFLGGHVQLAREAHRSVLASEMLNQQLERSRLLGNAQARDITPTFISQKAGQLGMVRPDERDAIVVQ